jgi:hypothetical protein
LQYAVPVFDGDDENSRRRHWEAAIIRGHRGDGRLDMCEDGVDRQVHRTTRKVNLHYGVTNFDLA